MAKILLLPPKYEITMLPSNHSFLQYCDSNIGLFTIAPCKVITLNPFCISSLLLFDGSLSKVIASNYRDSGRSFSLLKAISKRLRLLFANAFKSVKATLSSYNYIGSNTEKNEPIYKTHSKILTKRLRSTTFAIAKLKER